VFVSIVKYFDGAFWHIALHKVLFYFIVIVLVVHDAGNIRLLRVCLGNVSLKSDKIEKWKMDINFLEKSWKTHVKRSWKVRENHLHCSVCTLL